LGQGIRIVIDRFHIAKLYRKSIDTVRKEEMQRLKALLSEEKYKKLKGLMWALRIQNSKLSYRYKAVLKRAFKLSPKLKEVYKLNEKLTEIFDTETSRNGGIRRLKNWIAKVQESDIKLFDTFIKTLEKRMYEIANYFVARENSGFVEGLNNRIKVLKRRAYGIVDGIHLFKRISLDLERSNLANHGR
jgi:transposase